MGGEPFGPQLQGGVSAPLSGKQRSHLGGLRRHPALGARGQGFWEWRGGVPRRDPGTRQTWKGLRSQCGLVLSVELMINEAARKPQ